MDYQIFKKNIEYYIDYFDMNNYINSLINSYSHGMRQKLMLTSAFIHNPEYLFVDEPIVGLDPMTIKLLVNELKRLSTENKIILVSSHILDIVKKICSDIILIDKGRIVFSGEAHDADFKKHLKQIFGDLT
jgi:ABC-2 type transport system ATP-binding protein